MTFDTRARRAAQGIHRAVEVMEMSTNTKEPRKVERFDRFRDRKQRNRRIGALVVGTAIAITATVVVSTNALDRGQRTTLGGQGGTPVASSVLTQIGTVTRSGAGCASEIDADPIPAGPGRLTFVNGSNGVASFDLFRLDGGVPTFERLEDFVSAGELYGGGRFAPPAGAVVLTGREVGPGASGTIVDNFASGETYAVVCAHPLDGAEFLREARRPFAIVGPLVVG